MKLHHLAIAACLALIGTPALAQVTTQACEYNVSPPTLATGFRGTIPCNNKGVPYSLPGDGTTAGTVQTPAATNANSAGVTSVSETLVWDGSTWRRQSANTSGIANMHPGDPATWWRYAPPTGGYLNSTTGVTVRAAAGAAVSNYIWGGECFAETLTTATEIELRDGAAGAAMFRTKITTAGAPGHIDFTFSPPLKGTANTLVEFAGVTASGTGAIYCNWQGSTGP